MRKRETERIVVVDENDVVIGEEEKEKCHDGPGILHRGFLAMVFNPAGELLLTRRSGGKRLWPGVWDGTVASHVFKGENYEQATKRRLREEIGLATDTVEYAFKFHYKIGYKKIGTEHEICAVTIIRDIDSADIVPNEHEISEVKFASPDNLIKEIRDNGRRYTPWLILAMERISREAIIAVKS